MKIAFLGDIAFLGQNSINDPDYKKKFAAVKAILDGCEYVVGNLESPLTDSKKVVGGKSAYLKCDPKNVEVLTYLGVTHVSLANNHIFDYGEQGLNDTIKALDQAGIQWYGVNRQECFIQSGGNKICFQGYCCYSTNGKGMGQVNVFNPLALETRLGNMGEAFPVLSIHWGQEHVHYPNYDHVIIARQLSMKKKILIHGHHPHVIQGIEDCNESVIAYSLGNFCFDDVYTKKSKQPLVTLSQDNTESFLLVIEFCNNEIVGKEIVPFSFAEGYYSIQYDLLPLIKEWSDFLTVDKSEYQKRRYADLASYINQRKTARNLEWYLKRLNFESFKMILASKNNLKQYDALITSYISALKLD